MSKTKKETKEEKEKKKRKRRRGKGKEKEKKKRKIGIEFPQSPSVIKTSSQRQTQSYTNKRGPVDDLSLKVTNKEIYNLNNI